MSACGARQVPHGRVISIFADMDPTVFRGYEERLC